MKGIVFTVLNDMVIEKFGFDVWEQLITKVQPASGGSYTAADTYPFKELQSLVGELSSMLKIDPSALVEAYGEYMFPVLASKYPVFLKKGITFKEFLKSIDGVIHIEVKKLYPDAGLPSIQYSELAPDKIMLKYQSPRKLCFLAMGLVHGAAKHFKVDIHIEQPICMHHNADHCRLEITIDT
jgi:hypothetical protein